MKDKSYYLNQEGENIFYVYIHRRLSDGKPFYVGKGKGKRAWRTDRNNPFWQSVRKKHGYTVDIVFDDLDEETAFQCEKDIILELKYFGYTLTNLTDGGDGPSGYVYSEETKQRMSEAQKTSEKVKEARKISSAKRKGVKTGPQPNISKALAGKPKSPEHIEATREARKSKVIYEFIHKDTGTRFTGTRSELQEAHSIGRMVISALFGSRPRVTAAGWVLVGVAGSDDPARFDKALERGRSSTIPSAATKRKMSESHLAFRANQRTEKVLLLQEREVEELKT